MTEILENRGETANQNRALELLGGQALIGARQPLPPELMALDGKQHGKLTPGEWRMVAMFQEPEIYQGPDMIMPGSEEALGDAF